MSSGLRVVLSDKFDSFFKLYRKGCKSLLHSIMFEFLDFISGCFYDRTSV